MKEEAPRTWRKVHFIALAAVSITGVILGSVLIPSIREVPVVRIVEKRVEVPVDRVVEKIVEKRVEVPSNNAVIKYVSDRTTEINGKPTYVISDDRINLWRQIKVGMTRQQVVDILGPPDEAPRTSISSGLTYIYFSWGKGTVWFKSVDFGGTVESVTLPEY
jgi:hypothetical protein